MPRSGKEYYNQEMVAMNLRGSFKEPEIPVIRYLTILNTYGNLCISKKHYNEISSVIKTWCDSKLYGLYFKEFRDCYIITKYDLN